MTDRKIVLVVDDEPVLRMIAVGVVEDAGLQAVEASNADEAIELLETRTDIRIVFTDIDMPGSIDGLKMAVAIRGRWPPIDLIITSGHCRTSEMTLPARAVFVRKPYDAKRVTAELRRMAA